jgi:cytochrome c2
MNLKISTPGKIGKIAFLAVVLTFLIGTVKAQDGEQLFQQCKACHSIGQGKLLGPDLLDMSKRHDANWLKNFIKSSQTMVKIGDAEAVAIFEEYNKLVMIDYNLPDADINAIIKYVDSFSTDSEGGDETASASDSLAAVQAAEYLASIDTEENRVKGKALFEGERNFKNGGASCVSCHHVNTTESFQGGLLAADLTKSFTRNGGLPGIKGILEFPPYPAMKDAYQHAAITEEESIKLQVFLMHADEEDVVAESSLLDLMKQGIIGVVILLVVISLVWFKRKKRSVNYQIIKRQRRFN